MISDADNESDTHMFAEAGEAACVVERQFRTQKRAILAIGERLRRDPPRLFVTCARGSSDHAATFAKYLIESRLRAPCASAAPSVSSVYGAPLSAQGSLCLSISQSGKSPDILRASEMYKKGGAFVVALTNTPDSPLAGLADATIDLSAGPERSVAATKSYIASLAAIARIVAHAGQDDALIAALADLPALLDEAWSLDWRAAAETLDPATSLFVLGRGPSFATAQEAALKLKETCRMHAEAYSVAEVLHGPATLVRPGFPVFAFAQNDETLAGTTETLHRLAGYGARVISAGAPAAGALALPVIVAHPLLQPVLTIQSFYRLANLVALRRGLDPDRPPNLFKVTETV